MEKPYGHFGRQQAISLAAKVPFLNITAIDIHFGRYFFPSPWLSAKFTFQDSPTQEPTPGGHLAGPLLLSSALDNFSLIPQAVAVSCFQTDSTIPGIRASFKDGLETHLPHTPTTSAPERYQTSGGFGLSCSPPPSIADPLFNQGCNHHT